MSLFNYECDEVKRIIDEVSPTYPQLTTYEKEWIFFHKYHYIPGVPVELECQEVIVNPIGTVQNAIPYPYKRAILKGNTLVNVIDKPYILSEDIQDRSKDFTLKSSIKSNTDYLIIYDIVTEAKTIYTGFLTNNSIWSNTIETSKTKGFLKLNSGANPKYFRFIVQNGNTLTANSIMIIEYQEGMENWDIPYFEGMQSVQMPVLTTSNEDGAKTNILTLNEEVELCGIGDVKDELDLITGELTQRIGECSLDGSSNSGKWVIRTDVYMEGYIYFQQELNYILQSENIAICDRLPYSNQSHISSEQLRLSVYNNGTRIGVRLSESKGVSSLDEFSEYLKSNPIKFKYPLATASIKTVALTKLNKPYEGTNNYHLTANIPCEAILEVPVVSTGKQTLQEINNY